MKILYGISFFIALCFCVAGVMGHDMAWAAAALLFFAAMMIMIGQRNNNDKK